MPDGSIQWNPASSEVAYTPQSDGTVDITMAAVPA